MNTAFSFSTFTGLTAIVIVCGFALAFLFRFFTGLLTPKHNSMIPALRPRFEACSRQAPPIHALVGARQKSRLRGPKRGRRFGDTHGNVMGFSRASYKQAL
jgi:hypothetical protein